MKKIIICVATALISLSGYSQKKPMNEFVDDLMQKMTLEEKIGQLNLIPAGDIITGSLVNAKASDLIIAGKLGAILSLKGVDRIKAYQELAVKKSRLGIPLIFGMDVIHGYETIFPIPLGMSCSWDMEAIENSARISAKEATADGIDWTYSPMVDIALDPRWGRMAEGAGEDPFLGSRIAEAFVHGLQGDGLKGKASAPSSYSQKSLMACLKHYALYGAVEAGRDYNTVDMSRVRMYNQYFPPYRAAVEAGVGSVMTSFNLVDYVPATANKWLVTDVLRNQWKFDGFVVTDYASIDEMRKHGLGNLKSCSVQALKAGTDMDMCANGYVKTLAESLKDGNISEEEINTACRRVLEAKYKLGLFDNPYKYCNPKRRKTDIYTSENRKAARDMAAESFVLLKNENNLLPLKKQGKIALVGPLANDKMNIAGTWSITSTPERYETIKSCMERAVNGKAQILYAQGCNVYFDKKIQTGSEWERHIQRGDDKLMNDEALRIANEADVIVCCMGEVAEMSGEGSSRARLEMPDAEMSLLKKLVATGKPVVLLNFSGRATIMNWEKANVNAIMNVWFGGSETGDALADVIFGDKNPSGKLTVDIPQAEGQIPLYYNHLNTGRPVPDSVETYWPYNSNYTDVRNGAAYPFGYGLSYTTYSYSEPRLSSTTMAADGNITATVTVKNTGSRDGDEIVQMYIRDYVAKISRPLKELKGFQRIHLKAGESKDVSFSITPDLLKYYDSDLNYGLDSGEFCVMIGPDSRIDKLVKFTVK